MSDDGAVASAAMPDDDAQNQSPDTTGHDDDQDVLDMALFFLQTRRGERWEP